MSTHFHQDPTLISMGAAGREQHFSCFALKSLLLFQNGYHVWMPYYNILLALYIHYRTTLFSGSISIEEKLSTCFPNI